MKIICVGRNYAEHAKELGNAVPEQPVIFIKPDSAVVRNNADFYYPEFSKDIHFECELAFRVGKQGKYVQEKYALEYLDGIGLGIDFTARDLQTEAKKKGLPWTLAKCFNQSAPLSDFLPMADFATVQDIHFEMFLNGEKRQIGHSADMIHSVASLIEYITKFIIIKKGDVIFTGTPAGVGAVQVGDTLEAYLEGKKMLDFKVK
ncbi:MAG: fumarylacetoacetate hydrolase family protein [Bacteroidia bacterium]